MEKVEIVVLDAKIIAKLHEEIKHLSSLIEDSLGNANEKWLSIDETCNLLKISKRTLQNYRDKKILPFSQIGGKIYFKMGDINAHLEKNYSSI